MGYYIRATGNNQLAGGTSKWLKVRSINRINTDSFELGVIIRGMEKYVTVSKNYKPEFLEFAKGYPGLMPISHIRLINEYEGK